MKHESSKPSLPSVRRQRLTLSQMDAFRAVMIAGSISGGARQLSISQPSLTRVIRRTEDVIGFKLFDRTKTGLLPTPEARSLFASLEHIQEQLEGLSDVIGRIAQDGPGRFQLGSSPSLARRLVPMALARFNLQFPRVPIHFDTVTIPNVADYLALGRGECFLTITPVDHSLVESRPLWPGRLLCLIPAGHVLCAKSAITVSDLTDEPLIVCEPNTPHRQMVDQMFAEIGGSPSIHVVVKVAQTAIGFVAEGLGLTVLDEFTAMDVPSEHVAVRPMKLAPRFSIYLNRSQQAACSRFTLAFEAALLEVLRERAAAATPDPIPSRYTKAKRSH